MELISTSKPNTGYVIIVRVTSMLDVVHKAHIYIYIYIYIQWIEKRLKKFTFAVPYNGMVKTVVLTVLRNGTGTVIER